MASSGLCLVCDGGVQHGEAGVYSSSCARYYMLHALLIFPLIVNTWAGGVPMIQDKVCTVPVSLAILYQIGSIKSKPHEI